MGEALSFPPTERFLRLCRAARIGGVGRVLIIEGGSDAERTALAETFASAMVCENPMVAPCGECPQCAKSARRVHPDIAWLEKDKKTAYSVEYIRSVRLDAHTPPSEAPVRTFIFIGADELGAACQNALLKLIEEPPEHDAFVFTLASAASLLPTVLSRSSRYTIGSDASVETDEASAEACAAFVSAMARRDERGMYQALRPLEKSGGDVCSALISSVGREIYRAMRDKTIGNVSSMLTPSYTFASLDRAYKALGEAERWRRSNVAPAAIYAGIVASLGVICEGA